MAQQWFKYKGVLRGLMIPRKRNLKLINLIQNVSYPDDEVLGAGASFWLMVQGSWQTKAEG